MRLASTIFLIGLLRVAAATSILIPMDEAQQNHLKAYGIAFFSLQHDISVDWLLNYRGGSFLMEYSTSLASECKIKGVYSEILTDRMTNQVLAEISSPAVNMNIVRMDKEPRIAVYSPKNELILDETDAVITVLDYAEIPYTVIYDEEILTKDALLEYDWIHLHHEDFTGQVSKGMFRQQNRMEFKIQELTATRLGYSRVSAMKADVVKKIHAFLASGGYLFAMCSGAETFDIALAAEGQDVESAQFAEGVDLNYAQSLAFENFELKGAGDRSFSDINVGGWGWGVSDDEIFTLFDFSAKWDIIPSILTQNHESAIREFSGLTTTFNTSLIKPDALILAENKSKPNVRYIYGELGKGHWTYYSGHDPEARYGGGRGMSRRTDLNLFPHSPGYRLILNNVLFPSASKKKRKT